MKIRARKLEEPRISEQWEGLRCEQVECSGLLRVVGYQTSTSLLTLHLRGGRQMGVRQGATAWRFVTKAKHLDFFAAGDYDAIVAGPAPETSVVVHIPPMFEAAVADEGQWNCSVPTSFGLQDRRLESLVRTLHCAPEIGLQGTAIVLVSVAIVDRLFELVRLPVSPQFTHILRRVIVEYTDENIASLDSHHAALLSGLGRTQFGKMFRSTFRVPLHQYVLERRIELARQRLSLGGKVTDLALDLGFSSHSHFTTVFRRITGVTPSDFRLAGRSDNA